MLTSGMKAWDRDISELGQDVDWNAIWDSTAGALKNPNHQYIYLKSCHRAYLTPKIRHQMGLVPDPFCSFCPQRIIGSFIHVVWEYPGVFGLWGKVISTLVELMEGTLANGSCCTSFKWWLPSFPYEKKKTGTVWLSGLTAAKKIVVQCWKHPHDISCAY